MNKVSDRYRRPTILSAAALCLALTPAAQASTLLPDASLFAAISAGQTPDLPPLPATLPAPADLPTLQRLLGGFDDDPLTDGTRPNPRALSNTLASAPLRVDDEPLSMLAVAMLQLLASHEIARSPTGPVSAAIPVNQTDTPGESVFSSNIGFNRSLSRDEDGTPQQLNDVTVAFDGSTVYGSDLARMALLRDGTTPFLRVDPVTGGLPLEPTVPGGTTSRVVAGDVRADENPVLEVLHVLFVKEHNRLAGEIQTQCGASCTNDQVFEAARYLVAKTQEKIFYDELLPVLLNAEPGKIGKILTDNNIDPRLVPQVTSALNSFTAAAGRLGHTQVADTIRLATPGGPAQDVPLSDCFFNLNCLGGASFEEVLFGARSQAAESVDVVVTDALRNAQVPGFGGQGLEIDLFATNIQRGRDHGLPDYFALRALLGLAVPTDAASALTLLPGHVYQAYGINLLDSSLDFAGIEIDLLVGLFGENRSSSMVLGETGRVLWALQFLGLSQEYEEGFASFQVASSDPGLTLFSQDPFADYLASVTMASLLAANTTFDEAVWRNAFLAPVPVPLPASGLLMLAGLAALMGSRRSAAARRGGTSRQRPDRA